MTNLLLILLLFLRVILSHQYKPRYLTSIEPNRDSTDNEEILVDHRGRMCRLFTISPSLC